MTLQNFFWTSNLKYLRNRKKISQDDLARALSITRSKLAAHESGKTHNPPIPDLIRVSEYFKISIDSLLKVDLSRIGELKLRELEAGNDVFVTGSNLRVLAITVNEKNRENVEYVPIKAKAGYRSGYSDPEYIASLPRFNLPNLSRSVTCRMFPTEGRSMYPIPENSDILTEYVTDWSELKNGTLCIVILKSEQQFLFKAVYNQVQRNRTFLLKSFNEEFADQEIPVGDILEIWKYHSHWTNEIPQAETSLGDITKALQVLQADVKTLLKR